MPGPAWKDVLLRTWKQQSEDNISLVAAGVAFYGFLALVPLLGSALFLAVSLPRTAAYIMHLPHYDEKTALQAFHPLRGLQYTFWSVVENLLLGANPRRAREGEAARRSRVLSLFPRLNERLGQAVRTMSGGEQQMVAIGRALMSNPDVLMLDEPSLGLSPLLVRELFATLRQVRDAGVGLLLVEQNARGSLAIADRGYLIENGSIVGSGTAAALLSDNAVRHAYLGGIAASAV